VPTPIKSMPSGWCTARVDGATLVSVWRAPRPTPARYVGRAFPLAKRRRPP